MGKGELAGEEWRVVCNRNRQRTLHVAQPRIFVLLPFAKPIFVLLFSLLLLAPQLYRKVVWINTAASC